MYPPTILPWHPQSGATLDPRRTPTGLDAWSLRRARTDAGAGAHARAHERAREGLRRAYVMRAPTTGRVGPRFALQTSLRGERGEREEV